MDARGALLQGLKLTQYQAYTTSVPIAHFVSTPACTQLQHWQS